MMRIIFLYLNSKSQSSFILCRVEILPFYVAISITGSTTSKGFSDKNVFTLKKYIVINRLISNTNNSDIMTV